MPIELLLFGLVGVGKVAKARGIVYRVFDVILLIAPGCFYVASIIGCFFVNIGCPFLTLFGREHFLYLLSIEFKLLILRRGYKQVAIIILPHDAGNSAALVHRF